MYECIYIYIYMMYIHCIYIYMVKKHINYLKIKVSFSSSQKLYQCEIFNVEYVHF